MCGYVVNGITNWLESKKREIRVKWCIFRTDRHNFYYCVPQGHVLGGLPYHLYINGIES